MSEPFSSLHAPGHQPTWAYRAGLGLVMAGMAVLPLLYLVLTVLAGWWVFYFATHHFAAIWGWHTGYSRYGLVLKVVCSVTPLVVGGAIVMAMVKPLLARRARKMQPLTLQAEVEPRVHALVQEICQVVGAPAPARIEINCDLNASAHFDGGLPGLWGNRLILTIGLPLVAGLTEQELAGVMAHEFGHFRQGAGMRATYLIRRVNHWFGRVVYERDGWDEMLADSAGTENVMPAVIAGCARAGVWLSRGLLWLLMMAGHALSGLLLRQMEYDADRWEMRVAGSGAFESTLLRLATLDFVLGDIHREMRRIWRKQLQLPDNLPVLLQYRVNHLPLEKQQNIENKAGLTKMGWLDTHPSAADRVRRARQYAEAGIFASEAPAAELFDNFDTLSRLVTLAHYEDDLNVPTLPDQLIPLERLLRAADAPAPPPAPWPVPMMRYDPSAFSEGGVKGVGQGAGGAPPKEFLVVLLLLLVISSATED